MRRRLHLNVVLVVLAIAAAGVTGAATASAKPLAPAARATIDKIAPSGIGDGITGVTVGISDPKLGTMVRSYGKAGIGDGPLTPAMHYRIASVSKTFTALAVLRLVAQHKLSLSARLCHFVPRIPNGCQITIRQLLAMRAGVYSYTNDTRFYRNYARNPLLPGFTPARALAIIRAHRAQAKPPGTTTAYSDSNYVLLGYVIEKVTGRSARRYVNSLTARLGLHHTSFPNRARLPAPFVRGYIGPGSSTGRPATTDVTLSNPAVAGTAGAMNSTVPDMLRYARQLGTGVGLTPRLWRLRRHWSPLTTSGVRVQYGLGLLQLGKWIGHDGSIMGYTDMVFYLPSRHASLVVMENGADAQTVNSQAVWGEIVKQLYPGTLTMWK
jgi:D-alanyl-D-alanine carboxypeptidase